MNADRDAINDRFVVVADLLNIPEPERAEAALWLFERDALDAVEAIATRYGINRDFLLTGHGDPAGSRQLPMRNRYHLWRERRFSVVVVVVVVVVWSLARTMGLRP